MRFYRSVCILHILYVMWIVFFKKNMEAFPASTESGTNLSLVVHLLITPVRELFSYIDFIIGIFVHDEVVLFKLFE